MNLRRVVTVFMAVATSVLFAISGSAQVVTSSITGVVKDATGAVVADAKVVATNEQTGVTYETKTSSAGEYTIPSLTPGQYAIAVTKAGFQNFNSVHNVLAVGQPLVVNGDLKVGSATETVQVESSYQRVETTNAQISDVVTEQQVKDLPINGRNPLALLTLEPGVVQRTTESTGSGTHVFGSRDRAHNVTIDGIDANESTVPNPQSNIQRLNPDNVQEFRTVTLDATAETGRNSGANVMIASKAGTNSIHGDAFEYLRNDALNSNEFYNHAQNQPIPKLNLNQFGFDVGGPLIKNKTFWFGSFQENIIKQSAPIAQISGIPVTYTSTLRNGIFRYVKGTVTTASGFTTTQNDPRLVDGSGNLVAGVSACATAASTNCIASYNINAANDPAGIGPDAKMLALAKSLPLPNTFAAGTGGDGLNFAGFAWNPPTEFKGPNYLFRIDHTFNESNKIFGRWLQGTFNTTQGDFLNARPELFPGFPPLGEVTRINKNLAIDYRHVFNPTLVNDMTLGFNRFAFGFTFGESNPGFGDPAKDPPYADGCIFGSTSLMSSPYCPSPHTARAVTTPQFIDNVTWSHGQHSIQAGVNFRFYVHNDSRGFFGSTMTQPAITFTSGRVPYFLDGNGKQMNVDGTKNVISSLGISSTDQGDLYEAIDELAGIPRTLRQSYVANFNANQYVSTKYATVYTRAHQYDTYIQDEWKLRPNLTLNGGVRWEYNPAPYDAQQTLQPNLPIDGSQGPVSFVKSDRWFNNNNTAAIAPRVGIAWSPDQKTAVRVGYGLFFDTLSTFQVTAIAGKIPGFMLGCTNTITSGTSTTPTNNADTVSTSAGCVAPSGLTGVSSRIANGFPEGVPAPSGTPSALLTQPAQASGAAPSIGAFAPNMKNPAVHEWDLTIQRELPLHFVTEVGYVGKRGTHLYRAYDLNQANASPAFIQSFNIARNNVLAGCNADGTGCPSGVTGQSPALLLTLVPASFLNSSSFSTTNWIRNNVGGVITAMDSATGGNRLPALTPSFFRPNPQFSQIFFQDAGGDSYYHGLFVATRRRFEQGMTFGLSYTFSKSIDDMSIDPTGASTGGGLTTTNSRTPTDIRNWRLDRAVSDFDNRHVIASNLLYELPFGKGKHFAGNAPRWVDELIGGWQLTTIYNYQSGEPLTIYSGVQTTNTQHTSTAIVTGANPGTTLHYNQTGVLGPVLWPTNAFVNATSANPASCRTSTDGKTTYCIPAAGQQGSSRNQFRGPGFWNTDAGLRKNFALTERFKMQFIADAFNVFNHPNFENPRNATVGSPSITSTSFGTVCCTTAAVASQANVNALGEPQRVFQLALKLNF